MPALTRTRRVAERWLPATVLAALAPVAFVLVVGGASAGAARVAESPPPRFIVSVSPDHGAIGSTFQATLTMTRGTCDAFDVGFYLDGAVASGLELAPLVTMPQSCRAVATVKVPSDWRPGPKRIFGTYHVVAVPRPERAATFTVDPSGKPAKAPTPAPPSPNGNAATASAATTQLAPSDPPSVRALIPPSSSIASDSPLPAAQVAPDRDAGPSPLLWTAVIGIIVIGLLGARAAHRHGWAAGGRRLRTTARPRSHAELGGPAVRPRHRHRR